LKKQKAKVVYEDDHVRTVKHGVGGYEVTFKKGLKSNVSYTVLAHASKEKKKK